MEPAQGILLKTFGNIADADLAAGQLRSHGIECVIKTDDCAGMYPSLGVIQLLVDPKLADDARQILREDPQPREPLSEAPIQSSDSSHDSRSPPRVYRFNSGMIVGLIVGALVHFSYTTFQEYHDGTFPYDIDRDGFFEEEGIWKEGHIIESRLDRNADGRMDDWIYYENDVAWYEQADENFDGRIDSWFTYWPTRSPSKAELDTDFNGTRDVSNTYQHGILAQADWRPNGTNVIVLRQLYRHGRLLEEQRDVNGDGRFDVSVIYDAFNTPVSTNHPQPILRSIP